MFRRIAATLAAIAATAAFALPVINDYSGQDDDTPTVERSSWG